MDDDNVYRRGRHCVFTLHGGAATLYHPTVYRTAENTRLNGRNGPISGLNAGACGPEKRVKKKVLLIAVSLHQGQKDRGGKPYIEHLQYVAENSCTIRKSIFLTESSPTQIVDQYALGVLHDSLEDVTIITHTGSTHDGKKEFLPLTAKHLIKMGVPDRVVRAIELLTKNKNEVNHSREVDKSTPESSWEAYKPQIMPLLAPDSDVSRESQILGICAKIADNRHNADFTRLPRKAHFLPSTMIRCATYGMSAAALICRAYELEREPIN